MSSGLRYRNFFQRNPAAYSSEEVVERLAAVQPLRQRICLAAMGGTNWRFIREVVIEVDVVTEEPEIVSVQPVKERHSTGGVVTNK